MPFLSELVVEVYNELARRLTAEGPIGLTTGIKSIDEAIGDGWMRQQLSYLVGDAGVGKSWLASLWGLKAAEWLYENPTRRPATGYVLSNSNPDEVEKAVQDKEGKPPIVVFWSLEMAQSPLVSRMMSQVGQMLGGPEIDSGDILRGKIDTKAEGVQASLSLIYETMQERYGKHLYLEFEAHSVDEFQDVLDALVPLYDVCLVIVDYFRLIDESTSDGNPTTAQSERSKKLRRVAREYDCHVLSIFDITREGQRAGAPQPYHMKGGTAAHYDSDLVLTLATEDDGDRMGNLMSDAHRHLVLRVAKGRYVGQSTHHLFINLATGFAELWDQRESERGIGKEDTHE